MSTFYISPDTETDLEVQPSVLKAELAKRWPDISISDVNEGNRLFTWDISKGTLASLHGYLDVTKQVIIIDGDIRDCAEFAIWYRPIVAETYKLVFYDEAYTSNVALGSNTSANQIIASF